MNVLVVGTGAMACWFSAQLARQGLQVAMLGSWPAGLEALRSAGVCLVHEDGSTECHPVRVAASPSEVTGANLALVLVKSWQTPHAAAQLAECLSPDGVAVTLQNGLGNRFALAEALGPGRVAGGVTTYGATLEAPGRVRAGGAGAIVLEAHPRLHHLEAWLRSAGLNVEMAPDVESLVWSKLVVNAAINPLAALLHVPNGELLRRPQARALMADLAREAAAVALAQGIPLLFPDPVAAVEEVAHKTALNFSSMFQDVLRGSQTEVDAINGAVVRAGRVFGVPAPTNQVIWRLVRALTPQGESALSSDTEENDP